MRLLIFFILVSSISSAQFTDSFIDGDFLNDPAWKGDTSNFKVVGNELKLSAPKSTDTSSLFTYSDVSDSALWEFRLKMDFNPSSSNYACVFLMADHSSFEMIRNAYYVKIGGSNDDVSLYKVEEGSHQIIIDGKNKRVDISNTWIDVQVQRDQAGNWFLYVDSAGNKNYILEGSISDSSVRTSEYFGITCRYTSTRSDKFYFDDIKVTGTVYVDKTPPQIIDHRITGKNKWSVQFSEQIVDSTIQADFIEILNSDNSIREVIYDSLTQSLNIFFNEDFRNGKLYELIVSGLTDKKGNQIKTDTIFDFINYPDSLDFKSILINEIMFKPNSSLLPSSEYVEIYNPTDNYIDLDFIQLSDLKDTVSLFGILNPYEHQIITEKSDSALWRDLNVKSILTDLPSLNNDEDALKLSIEGKIIDSVRYFDDQLSKAEEGRSIELVNPFFICSDTSNWKASIHSSGGSPGELNSKNNNDIPEPNFGIQKIVQISDSSVIFKTIPKIRLNKSDQISISINPSLNIKQAHWGRGNFMISLGAKYLANQNYTLSVDNLEDCFHRSLDNVSFEFTTPDVALNGNIIINEILADPELGGAEFIEIRNISTSYFDLNTLSIQKSNPDSARYLEPLSSEFYLIEPGDVIAFTKDSLGISGRYPSPADRIILNSNIPSLNNDEGEIYLMNIEHNRIDLALYKEEYHFPLLTSTKGVSLERISSDVSGVDSHNWTSASSNSNYGTPGEMNSQELTKGTSFFNLQPDIFSPDNDGYQDQTSVNLTFNKAGYWGNISIYNDKGILIRKLVENDIFPVQGKFIWNGLNDHGLLQPPGFYLVILDSYHPNGDSRNEKRSLVIANKFK